MYDVRCTIAEFARFARGGGAWQRLCTTVAADAAHVRSTKYEVRLRCSRALRGDLAADAAYVRLRLLAAEGGGRRGLPMYDFRCTMYD